MFDEPRTLDNEVEVDVNSVNDYYEQFLSSTAYLFYTNPNNAKKHINDNYLTEEQLITEIKKSGKYDIDFIEFCREKYTMNKNIMIAIYDYFVVQNVILNKQNDILKNEKSILQMKIL